MDFRQGSLDPVHDLPGVLSLEHQHQPDDCFAVAVSGGPSNPKHWALPDFAHVFHKNGCPLRGDSDHDFLQVFDPGDHSLPTDDVCLTSFLDDPSAAVQVVPLHGLEDLGQGEPVG